MTIYSEIPRHGREDIKIMKLDEWVRDYCCNGDKLQVIVSKSGEVVIKCLVNITWGTTFIVGEL